MSRKVLASLVLAAALLGPRPAGAADAAKVRQAAEQFDLGVTAQNAKDWENAASRFEAADAAVPGARALRQAIKSRAEAKQGSRAATLAALALARHPNDKETTTLANEIVAKFAPSLHKVAVSCASPCVLAVGTRSVHGEATTRWTVYVDPGPATISASFFGSVSAKPIHVDAKAGRSSDVRFDPEEGAAPPPPPPPKPSATPSETASAEPPPAPPPPQQKRNGLPVWVFAIGAVATGGLGAVTIWSGIDTIYYPGVDKVRTDCAGQGTDCPTYQLGLQQQTQTNVLIGVTSGVGAATILIAIFTDWGGKKAAAPQARFVTPWVAPVGDPGGSTKEKGAALGVRGSF